MEKTINSIVNQTYKNWQLLILDDGSTDKTREIATTFKDSRVQLLSDGLHKGITARLNQAIELAQGKYFARMDADDFAYPVRLAKQIAFLESNPSIDLVGTNICYVDSEGNASGVSDFPSHHTKITATPWLKSISIAHPTWCGKTAWFQKWEYRNVLKNEDQDLLLRAHESSRFANLPDVLLEYNVTSSFKKSLLSRCGSVRMMHDYYIQKRQPSWYILSLFLVFIKFFLDFFTKRLA